MSVSKSTHRRSVTHRRGGRATTRSNTVHSKTRKAIYRKRVKKSLCRGKSSELCRLKNGCKSTKSGKRKSYCRQHKNRSAGK